MTYDIDSGACAESGDGGHCDCWWNCAPCCRCGYDGGGEDCDCERHTAERVQNHGSGVISEGANDA